MQEPAEPGHAQRGEEGALQHQVLCGLRGHAGQVHQGDLQHGGLFRQRNSHGARFVPGLRGWIE